MRTTVGPLPSAVYWRRRAVVAGAILLAIIVLFVSCSGGGDDKSHPQGKSAASTSSLPTPGPAGSSDPDDEPSFVDNPPAGNGPSLPDPAQVQSQQPGVGTAGLTPTAGAGATTGANTNVTAPADGSCSDNQLQLTPIPATTTIKRSAPAIAITYRVKNIGSQPCSRDLGSDPQELYLSAGAQVYWSSDKCSPGGGHDVRQLPAGGERDYNVTWNGRESSTCTGGVAGGPVPPPGQFQLRARLGTLVSNPVVLTFVN
jgi:hypothetical protein